MHYARWQRLGATDLPARPTTEQRFWAKVDASGICWGWIGAKSDNGYGSFYLGADRGSVNAHRASWEMLVGQVPVGLVLDHLCRNRACVNPDHLEPVTERENIRRGSSPMVRASMANVCPRGHSLEDAYLAHRAGGKVTRSCRTCTRSRQAKKQPEVFNIRELAYAIEQAEMGKEIA